MSAPKKAPNSVRTENVSVRLDPKLYYLAGIAAREQMRTRSGFIEWAVRRTLSDAAAMADEPMPGSWPAPQPPLWMQELWDADEADRFFRLSTARPGLLTIPEQRLWKLFLMHMEHTKRKPSIVPFREFWNNPSINTEHLKDGE